MSVFLQAGAAFGFLEVMAARASGSLPLEDAAVLFLFPIFLFASAGAGLDLGVRAWSLLRGSDATTTLVSVSSLAACVLPVLIQGLRGCLRECGFTPEQWGLRFLPTVALIFGILWCRRWLARLPSRSASRLVFLASALSILFFETRFDVGGHLPFQMVPAFVGSAVVGMMVFVGIDSRTGHPWASVLGLALLAAGAALMPSAPAAPVTAAAAVQAEREAPSAAPSFNILLIVLDGVRADRMPPTVNRQAKTPAFDAFAQSSYVFTRGIASSNYSLPSHASLLTGLLPSEHGAHPFLVRPGSTRAHIRIRARGPTVAQRLKAAGFETFGVSSNFVFLRPWTGLQRGFDRFDDRPRRLFRTSPLTHVALSLLSDWVGSPFRPLLPYRQAKEIRLQLQQELSRAHTPFFAFVNLMDAHEPRVPRTPRNPWSPTAARIRSYDDSVEYLDEEIGELLRWMGGKGLLQNTCVVLTADHGEFLGEQGLWGNGFGVAQPVVHIPLLIRPPGGLGGATIVEGPLGLHEVMPLVLSWVSEIRLPGNEANEPRLLAEAWSFPGGGPTEGLPDQRAIFLGGLKLVAGRAGERQLFDLVSDPGESRDLWRSLDPEPRARFEAQALRPVAPRPRPSTTPDAEAIERMRSLGYLGPSPKR